MRNIEYESFNDVINTVHLKILEHGHLYAGTDWKFLQLSSPFNRLYFVIKGDARIRCGNEEIMLEPERCTLFHSTIRVTMFVKAFCISSIYIFDLNSFPA
jgi:hypothetical protein